MSLAKSVVTGTVYRAPEKRFTQNNIAVSAFVLNIGEREETLIRVISRRNALDEIVSSILKGERVLVEGRLQTAAVKMDDGSEKESLKSMPIQSKNSVKVQWLLLIQNSEQKKSLNSNLMTFQMN